MLIAIYIYAAYAVSVAIQGAFELVSVTAYRRPAVQPFSAFVPVFPVGNVVQQDVGGEFAVNACLPAVHHIGKTAQLVGIGNQIEAAFACLQRSIAACTISINKYFGTSQNGTIVSTDGLSPYQFFLIALQQIGYYAGFKFFFRYIAAVVSQAYTYAGNVDGIAIVGTRTVLVCCAHNAVLATSFSALSADGSQIQAVLDNAPRAAVVGHDAGRVGVECIACADISFVQAVGNRTVGVVRSNTAGMVGHRNVRIVDTPVDGRVLNRTGNAAVLVLTGNQWPVVGAACNLYTHSFSDDSSV